MLWQSLSLDYYGEYGPGAGLLPLWVNCFIIVLSLGYLVMAIKKDIILFQKVFPKGDGRVNVLISMGSPILFLIIVPYVGFIVGSIITLFILYMRGYKWYWSLSFSAALSFIIFWVFGTLLQVPLPVNNFGW